MVTNHKFVCARAARLEFAEAFRRGIQDYRGCRLSAAVLGRHLATLLPDALPLAVLRQLCDREVAQLAWDGSVTLDNGGSISDDAPFRIMARKRPLHVSSDGDTPAAQEDASAVQDEATPSDEGDEASLDASKVTAYECVSVEGANRSVVVHDGRVHRDGRTLYMAHSRFCLDRVFNERADNQTVYAGSMPPLLKRVREGGRATLLLFGQTGTGKTYTARGLLENLASDLFSRDEPVTVTCFELAGSRGGREAVFDLLAERKMVKCLTGEDGNVHVRGAREVPCASAEELHGALRSAFEWRSSEATERNEVSSRSHAVIELRLSSGVLRIVDLAGSERNFETQQHTRKMAERGGHINYSLLMLKECARIMHRNRQRRDEGNEITLQHIPFRSSRLTHLLQTCFTDPEHRTAVITTLSPSPPDVEHTLNSLQHVGMMRSGRVSGGSGQAASKERGGSDANGFSKVEGRGHGLHSGLQDARQQQLKFRAFDRVGDVGGSVMKKYEPENVKKEAFIDPTWHREMKVVVEEDLWVLKDADAEAVQMLTRWREEQWQARRAHDVARWDAAAVAAFVREIGLEGQVRVPSTMTGAQLCRLGNRGLAALCGGAGTPAAETFLAALQRERLSAREEERMQAGRNAKLTALGQNRMHAALDVVVA
eukprot:TRINITY_DN15045_c1_g1_i4.p1 TRINITY_DN15045_c1_g1~~TRINITY_DN15045_c1_g1_i4.p1  ORF type:complete len:670 (-),score=146.66 TRINITY_DN15045_c1_g1_i4:880-2847(-)